MRIIARIALGAALLVLLSGGAWAGERVSVELHDGGKVEGEVLKKDARFVHISLDDQVITLDREKIKEMISTAGEEEGARDIEEFSLYRTGIGVVKAISALSEELGPAIVSVKTPGGLGTGWFCHPDGYVVTNAHVIANERSIAVTAFERQGARFERRDFKKVKIVALNEEIDLALLKIEEEIGMEIPQLYIGDSSEVREGDPVFTIGNPMGLERSTAQGDVSKVSRSMGGRLYIQSTTPISPGNSGGPLFNERGEVIGVANMGYIYLDGLGFAIPSRYVREFLDNVEAFAYDPDNPNAGIKYMEAPITATDGSLEFVSADFIKAGHGISALTLADVNGDGVEEVVFVNNNKGEIGVLRRRLADEQEPEALDFEDINRIPDSERFVLDTHAVSNRIAALAVSDMNEDGRPDIVFHGDIDGLAVMDQQEDGSFGAPRRLADVEIAGRADALCVEDLDGDGRKEVFALGQTEFNVIDDDGEREAFPLHANYRDRISQFEIADVNDDGLPDLVLFAADKQYAAQVVAQNADGQFIEQDLVSAHLSGPVEPFEVDGQGRRYLTLDKGQNRVRELVLEAESRPVQQGRINVAAHAIVLDAAPAAAEDFELADLTGDGRLEIVTYSGEGNEFLIFEAREGGFADHRSPAPRGLVGLKLFQPDNDSAVLFSYSEQDKIFGVSLVEAQSVSYPRPINTEGVVQLLWLGRIDGGQESLVWVEKVGRDYVARAAPAAALAREVTEGGQGSIDVEAQSLLFGDDEADLEAELPGRPANLSFADFNGDAVDDLIVFWAYSGKETLYLGLGEGRYKAVIADQEFLEEQEGQPLLVADIDADGADDVLLIQPGFVRVLRVDDREKLYVERQFNWEFEEVSRLVPYGDGERPRFVALSGSLAKVVEFDLREADFDLVATIDLAGLQMGELKVGDLDANGAPDLLLLGGNAIQVIYALDQRTALRPRIVFDAKLDTFSYWNIHPADLDADGADEVMLFDRRKAVFEIYRPADDGQLQPLLRHRLFEKSIHQMEETDSLQIPNELAVGDVNGDGTADLVFVLQDRVAIYLQKPPEQPGRVHPARRARARRRR